MSSLCKQQVPGQLTSSRILTLLPTRTTTQEIRQQNVQIQQDTSRIFDEIARLRAMVAQRDSQEGQRIVIDKYLESLTTYAQSEVGDDCRSIHVFDTSTELEGYIKLSSIP